MKADKIGLDDWIRSGGTKEQLFDLIQDPEPDWKSRLVLSETGNVRVNTFNMALVIAHDPAFDEIRRTRFNDLTKRLELPDGTPIETPRLTEIAGDIEGAYRTGLIQVDLLGRVLEMVGTQNRYHPIRDWLDSLPAWDQTRRIDRLFINYYGAADTPYVRSVGKNLLVASVARIYRPGCKFDHVVVLEGAQGIGKSSSIVALFGQEWATTSRADIASKDFVSGVLGFWAIELSELSSLRKSQIEAIKAVLSVTEDDVRLPYRRDTKRYPRQSIFIASTNEDSYLKDGSGNRRFWPVRCAGIDLAGLRRDRGQLFAEALYRFKNGESWYEVPQAEAKSIQEERLEADSWQEIIAPWLLNRWEVTTSEVLSDCLEIEKGRHARGDMTRIGIILKKLGWEKKRDRKPSGLSWIYVPTSNVGTGWNNVGTTNKDGLVPTVPTENLLHFKTEKTIDNTCTHAHTHTGIGVKNDDLGWNVGTSNADGRSNVVPTLDDSDVGTLPTEDIEL